MFKSLFNTLNFNLKHKFILNLRTYSSNVYLVDGVRTPIGSFKGSLRNFKATELGSIAVKSLLERTKINESQIDELYFGNVLQAGNGQAPTRQVALNAGLSLKVVTTTINKVCASGLKSIMLAAQHVTLNPEEILIAGGMESMSNVPFYLKRGEIPYGGMKIEDGILKDGLTDSFSPIHMGNCGENTCKKFFITREQQDDYAKISYQRAIEAQKSGVFSNEIISIIIKGKKGKPDIIVSEDEEISKVNFEKFSSLPTVFDRENGTITAANASKLNDGASACLIMNEASLKKFSLKPLAEICAFADGACAPIDFPIAPVEAINKTLKLANLNKNNISRWEINEAFSCVVLANQKLLDLDIEKINVNGGAVSLGHPIGMSGARIAITLAHNLKVGEYGLATICNGGGGASAIILKKLCNIEIEEKLPILKFYTKKNCGLCDEVIEKLKPILNKVKLIKVDIEKEENKKYLKLYRYDIPVVELDNKIVLKNKKIDVNLFFKYIDCK